VFAKFWFESLKGRNCLEDISIGERILKWILSFLGLRIGTSGRLLQVP
jgi:hypothetical protein